MANTTITNLPLAIALTGTEQLPAVQSTTTVRLTVSQIATYTTSTIAAPVVTIGGAVSGGTPGNGLYVSSSGTLGEFPYGAGIFNAIQIAAGSNGSPVLFNGAGGTPTSLTLTLGSISVSGATNGYLLYNNAGVLGAVAPTAASLSIGSPITGGTSGYGLYVDASNQLGEFAYGTGVRTALGVNVGSAGAPVLFNGAGGTPSSINLTGATALSLPIGSISATGTPSITTYLRGDGAWASITGGSGTVTSVSFTGGIISVATPTSTPALTVAGTSGGIPYFSSGTAWASSAALASNALVIGGGAGAAPATTTTGTGVLTAIGNATNAASGIAVKDANANLSANGFFETFTAIAAAGTVTTLTASSAYSFIVNGSGGHTIQLPDATTLPVGAIYLINNNQTSGTVVVRNNSATTIVTLQSGSYVEITLTANSPAAGTWDVHALLPSAVSWSTNTLTWTGTIASGTTWNGAAVGILYGGTGQTTAAAGFNALSPVTTTGDLIVGNGTNSSTRLGIGTTGQILTVSGGTAAWGQVSLTAGVTGVLPVANGGTNITSFGTGVATALGQNVSGSGSIVLGTSPTVNNPTVTNYVESVVAIGTVTTANTIALTNGTVQTATLTASTACTFTMPTATAGKSFVLLLKQAATTGNGTATFTSVKWGTAGAPTITATAGKMDILTFIADGTNWYGSIAQGYTP
jgi:hypothetical protein